jgi:hypothetical protein
MRKKFKINYRLLEGTVCLQNGKSKKETKEYLQLK